jgi:hypothetical protein
MVKRMNVRLKYVNDEYDEGANSDAESDYEYSTADKDELYKVTNDPHSQSTPYNYLENRRADQGFGPNTRSSRTDQELDQANCECWSGTRSKT